MRASARNSHALNDADAPWLIDSRAVGVVGDLVDGVAGLAQVAAVGRRSFLVGSVASLSWLGGSELQDLRFHVSADGFELRHREAVLWSVRVDWLTSIAVRLNQDAAQSIRLSGRIPGLDLPVIFQAALQTADGTASLRLEHSLWHKPVLVSLADWLSGAAQARAPALMLPRIHCAHAIISQAALSNLAIAPDMRLIFEGEDAFVVRGRILLGQASRLEFGPAAARFGKVDARDRASHMMLVAGTNFAVSPTPSRAGLHVKPFEARSVVLELRESSAGRRDGALLVRAAGVVSLRHRAAALSFDSRASLSNVTYVAEAGAQYLFAKSTHASVQTRDAVLRASTPEGMPTKVVLTQATCKVDCTLRWHHIGVVHGDGVTMQLRRVDVPDADNGAALVEEYFDGAPWLPIRIDLSKMELTATRPEDGLWLRFRFHDMELVRSLSGFRLRCRTAAARMIVVLPPQAIAEEALFRAPGWAPPARSKLQDAFGVPNASNANEDRKSLRTQSGNFDNRDRDPVTQSTPPPGDRLIAAYVSGESALHLSPVQWSDPCRLRLDEMLDPCRWSLVVADSAYASLQDWRDKYKRTDGFPDDFHKEDLDAFTHIEMPLRMQISPPQSARLVHARLGLARDSGFNSLFYLSAQVPSTSSTPYRVVYSEDSANVLGDHDIPGPGKPRLSLDRRDRNELVWLSGRWGRDALFGSKNVVVREKEDSIYGTYDPQPFQVLDIRLTSFGGSMRSEGTWDPPYLRPRVGQHDPNAAAFALSIEQWGHRSTLARTHFERVEYRGWLLPFGFRATLIKLTRRQNDDWGGYATAVDIQRYYIKCVEPVLQFPLVGQPVESVNGFCQPEQFELLLPNDLQIDDPGAGIQGHGMSAFWIRSGNDGHLSSGEPWKFDLQVGVGGRAQCSLVFVDNTTTHDIKLLGQVADEYNGRAQPRVGDDSWRTMTMKSVPVCFAPPNHEGDTSFPTDRMKLGVSINTQLIDSTLLEAAKQPPIYPIVEDADITVRAIQTQSPASPGGASTVKVSYNALYRDVGFLAGSNPSEAFLDLATAQSLSFSGSSDRSGGVATPNSSARALSRLKGLLYSAPQGTSGASAAALVPAKARPVAPSMRFAAASARVDAASAFDGDAMLLGAVSLKTIFADLGLEDVPALVEKAEQSFDDAIESLETKVGRYLGDAEEAIRQMNDAWTTASSAVGWTTSPLYLQIHHPLDTLNTDRGQLATALPSKDVVAIGKALGLVGKDVASLRTAIDTLSRRPELVMGALLRQSEIGALLEWFANVRISWTSIAQEHLSLIKSQVDVTTARVTAIVSSEFKPLDELERVDVAQTQQAFLAVKTLGSQVQGISLSQPQDILPILQTVLAAYPALYSARQAFNDQAQQVLTKATQAKAFADQLSALAQTFGTHPIRTVVLDACKTWSTTLDAAFATTAIPEAKKARQAIGPTISQVEDLLIAIADAELPKDGSAPRIVKDAAFLRLGLVLVFVAPAVKQQLDKWQQAEIKQIATLADKASNAAAAKLLGYFALTNSTVQLAWSNLDTAATDLQGVLPPLGVADYAGLVQAARDTYAVVKDVVQGRGDPVQQAQALLSLSSHACSLSSCLADPTGSTCREQWPGVSDALDAVDTLLGKVFSMVKDVLAAFFTGADAVVRAAGTSPLGQSILGTNLVDQFTSVVAVGQALQTLNPTSPLGWMAAAQSLPPQSTSNWLGLIDLLDQADFFRDLQGSAVDVLKQQIVTLAQSFVPSKIRTTYDFSRSFQTGSDTAMFQTGGGADCSVDSGQVGSLGTDKSLLELQTTMEADLIAGTSRYEMNGKLLSFRINLFGFISLPIKQVAFTGSSDAGFRLQNPQMCTPHVDGALQFVAEILQLIGLSSDVFVEPSPSGVRAGYKFSDPLIQAGGMTIENLDFEASISIPFDGSASTVDLALADAESPLLLSIGIYGGGGYMQMSMTGAGLISVEAAFEAGLVGAFDLAVISGTGRVTVGIFFSAGNQQVIFGGTFYVGGHATVLGIVSISADLSLSLVSEGKGAVGTGRFRVRVGFGIFAWSLTYSVTHSQGTGQAAAAAAPAARMDVQRAPATATPIVALLAEPPNPASPSNPTLTPHDGLLNPETWQRYQSAFLKVAA